VEDLPDWDLPSPHVHVVEAVNADIDGYGHVNNAVYLRWLDQAAWSHSTALGLDPETCLAGGRSMAVWRTQANYLAPAFAGDRLQVGTWIIGNDGRLRVSRRFQVRRAADGACLLRALIHYVCIELSSGRARRMPASFVTGYAIREDVAHACALEPTPFAPGVEP